MPKSPLSRDLTVPTGCIEPFAGDISEIPFGWLLCDGSTINRSEYSRLFEKIGTAHGQGNGSTTFHLPDLRGRFIRGTSNGSSSDPERGSRTSAAIGGNTGDNVGSLQNDKTRRPRDTNFSSNTTGNHTHTPTSGTLIGIFDPPTGTFPLNISNELNRRNNVSLNSSGNHSHSITGGGDVETRPVNVYMNYIIKT